MKVRAETADVLAEAAVKSRGRHFWTGCRSTKQLPHLVVLFQRPGLSEKRAGS